jgi:hypothetical protein
MSFPPANDYCPCESGKKYKRCCREGDLAATGGLDPEDLEIPITTEIADWVMERDPDVEDRAFGCVPSLPGDDEDEDETRCHPFALHLAAYHAVRSDGRRWVEVFRDEATVGWEEPRRRWLDAAIDAWCAPWKVESVVRGRGAEAEDLLTGERRTVRSPDLAHQLKAGSVFLGRVTRFGAADWLTAPHSWTLQEEAARLVIDLFRERLEIRPEPLVPTVLRGSAAFLLADLWAATVEEVVRLERE